VRSEEGGGKWEVRETEEAGGGSEGRRRPSGVRREKCGVGSWELAVGNAEEWEEEAVRREEWVLAVS
jgi:hypothetical protein